MFTHDKVCTLSYGLGFIFPSVSEYAFVLTIWELSITDEAVYEYEYTPKAIVLTAAVAIGIQ